jgi:hypothetical protein
VIKINDRYTFTDKSGAQLFSMFLCGKIKGRAFRVHALEPLAKVVNGNVI